MNRFFVVALMATCFAANAALETIPLTTNESGRVGWEIGLARSNINAMVELIPELDSKIGSTSNAMAAAIALKQDALPQAGHGELLYSLFGFPAWLDGASSYAIMMHNGTTVNWLDKPAGETGSGLLAFGQTNGLHWTGNGYPYSFNGEVGARMKIPASDLSTDYEDGFYGLTVQNGEISFGEIQDPETITNDWSEVIAAIPVGDPDALSGRFTVTSTAPLTLVVSNGLVYAVLSNGDLVDVTYYLPAYAVTEPTTNYPAGFAEFAFDANTTNVSASAPQIAEWTRQALPGDTIMLTAENLDPTNALFVFMDGSGTVLPGDIVALDGRKCAVTLPDGLATNSFYLMWPFNGHGFGEPVGINQTRLDWIGFDQISTNETFYTYGQKQVLGASTEAHLYCIESGEWINSTTNSNPYRAEYVLPATYANGVYTFVAHNGYGGKYGWSLPRTVTVRSPVHNYNNKSYNMVTSFGADPTGATDSLAAFNGSTATLNANPYSMVTIPAGTYKLSGTWYPSVSTKYVGAGTNDTIITTWTNEFTANTPLIMASNRDTFSQLTLKTTAKINYERGLSALGKIDVVFDNILVDQREDTEITHGLFDCNTASRITIQNCTTYQSGGLGFLAVAYLRATGNRIYGLEDINQISTYNGATYCDFSGNTISPYDTSDPSEGFGWTKGRLMVDNGNSFANYFADNETIDLLARAPTPFAADLTITAVGPTNTWDGSYYHQTISTSAIDDGFQNRGDNSTSTRGTLAIVTHPVDGAYGYYIYTLNATNDTVVLKVPSFKILTYTNGMTVSLRDIVDQNSGEQWLNEGGLVKFYAYATTATSNTVTVPGISVSSYRSLAIVDGRGMGQYRRILSTNTGTGVITIDGTWSVEPDETSLVYVGRCQTDYVFYNNTFDATPNALGTAYSASAGISLWGGTYGTIIDGNTFHELRGGVKVQGLFGASVSSTQNTPSPMLFNDIKNNVFLDNYLPILVSHEVPGITRTNSPSGLASLGNTYRHNTISGVSNSVVSILPPSPSNPKYMQMQVFDQNTATSTTGMITETAGTKNIIYIGNTLTGTGTAITASTNNSDRVFGNTLAGFTTGYSWSSPVLQIPQGTVVLSDASKTIDLFNVGTTGLTWTATDNAAWLSVTASGAIAAESSGTMTLSRSGSTTNGAAALVSVVAAGQTNVFTVIYGDELGAE